MYEIQLFFGRGNIFRGRNTFQRTLLLRGRKLSDGIKIFKRLNILVFLKTRTRTNLSIPSQKNFENWLK